MVTSLLLERKKDIHWLCPVSSSQLAFEKGFYLESRETDSTVVKKCKFEDFRYLGRIRSKLRRSIWWGNFYYQGWNPVPTWTRFATEVFLASKGCSKSLKAVRITLYSKVSSIRTYRVRYLHFKVFFVILLAYGAVKQKVCFLSFVLRPDRRFALSSVHFSFPGPKLLSSTGRRTAISRHAKNWKK